MRASFTREIGALDEIFAFVRRFFSDAGIDREYLFAVDLVVEGVFTNLVKYNRSDRQIDIGLDRTDDRLTIRLVDHDVDRFDLTASSRPAIDRPLEERPIGGLGIHLVHKFMDEVDYSYADRESTITLVKKIKAAHA